MQNRKKEIPLSAPDEPILELGPGPLEMLWEKHKAALLIGTGAVIVAVIGFFTAMFASQAKRSAAMDALAGAADEAALTQVISDFPGSVEAGNASLLLASKLRKDGKPDEASEIYSQIINSNPKHPLAPLAFIGLAGIAAQKGDVQAMTENLQRISNEYPTSFAVPFALLSEAELSLATGDRTAALDTFQRLSRQFPSSVASNAGQNSLVALEAMLSTRSEPPPAVTASEIEMPATEPDDATMNQVIDEDADPFVD